MKIDENSLRKLCMDLIKAESEADAINILTHAGYWEDESAWDHYGNNESNFSEIGNQAANADAAIVEKYINSVDAMLLAKCAESGKKADSEAAPQSISEALNDYFGITNGKLATISSAERSVLAENIGLVATGDKERPCYSFFDFGLGQSPSQFPDTFLSLAASNKIRIQFVQGRFNMGSTGVLQFCGDENIQLIVSRKHPAARKGLNDGNKWGFTVVRRENPQGQMKSSVYKYLAPKGKIPAFGGKDLPILPSEYPNPYDRAMSHGTYVKVYDYNIGAGLRTNILFDLYNRLSILTPSLALPVRLYERRKGFKGNSFETNLAGLTVRLTEDRQDNLEDGFPASHVMNIDGHKMTASIYAFKKGAIKKYAKGEGIILALNGQTHGSFDNNFFRRMATGMSYLADSLLVVVDCSSVDGRAREDLFMNSRERLRSSPLKLAIEKDMESTLKNHPGLKALREKRQADAIKDKLDDSKPLKEILESIIKTSPSLSRLFKEGMRITDPFKTDDHQEVDTFKGQLWPSFFSLDKEYKKTSPKSCHKNFRFRIGFKTDAENHYFDRDIDPGIDTLFVNGKVTSDYSLSMWNVHATLSAALPKNTKIGDLLHYRLEVTDASRVQPIENDIYVSAIQEGKSGPKGKKNRREASSEKKGGKGRGASQLDVPDPIPVQKAEWEERDFDEQSALAIVHTGEGRIFNYFYNADNVYLKLEQKSAPDDADIIEAQFKTSLVLFGLSLINEAISQNNREGIEDHVQRTTRAISPVLLPIIRALGELTLDK